MPNHPNRRAWYRLTCGERVEYVATRSAALAALRAMACAPMDADAHTLANAFGATLQRVSRAVALAGLKR